MTVTAFCIKNGQKRDSISEVYVTQRLNCPYPGTQLIECYYRSRVSVGETVRNTLLLGQRIWEDIAWSR